MGCGKRGSPGAFGVFINCTDCGSDQIMDADIWDRYGPKDLESFPSEHRREVQREREQTK